MATVKRLYWDWTDIVDRVSTVGIWLEGGGIMINARWNNGPNWEPDGQLSPVITRGQARLLALTLAYFAEHGALPGAGE
ncbi:MAG: hypothetical protein ACRDGM_17990 [bacterium]